MATIRIATNLLLDNDGYANAKLSIEESVKTVTQSSNVDKHSLMEDTKEIDIECFDLVFDCDTNTDNSMRIVTSIFNPKLNADPVEIKRIGSKNVPIYNKFTTVLLRLNIVTKGELDKAKKDIKVLDIDTIMSEFLAIKNLPVKFKPQKKELPAKFSSSKSVKRYITEPNLLTLEITGEMISNE